MDKIQISILLICCVLVIIGLILFLTKPKSYQTPVVAVLPTKKLKSSNTNLYSSIEQKPIVIKFVYQEKENIDQRELCDLVVKVNDYVNNPNMFIEKTIVPVTNEPIPTESPPTDTNSELLKKSDMNFQELTIFN